eukprot:SAG11_NODE_16943_length_533_cov_0.785714_1_plen_103_part_10
MGLTSSLPPFAVGGLSKRLVAARPNQLQLSENEKHRVKAQLLDFAKVVPMLGIFALPGGGMLLPILAKVQLANFDMRSVLLLSEHRVAGCFSSAHGWTVLSIS